MGEPGGQVIPARPAIAPVAGTLALDAPNPAHPVAVIAFHGTADEHVLYEGGKPKKRVDPNPRDDKSQEESIGFWRRRNGCVGTPTTATEGNIKRETWRSPQGADVVHITIEGGGHAWPGGTRGSRRGDEPTREISATDAMWEFFTAHPKAG